MPIVAITVLNKSRYLKEQGIEIIVWTLERSGAVPSGWYLGVQQGNATVGTHGNVQSAVRKDADIYLLLDVLFKVGASSLSTSPIPDSVLCRMWESLGSSRIGLGP